MTTTTMTLTLTSDSWFDEARFIAPDAIFALTVKYIADPFSTKVNLGQGTYRDESGKPWVLPSVQKGREMVLSQNFNHEYLPILGLREFRERATELVLGPEIFGKQQGKLAICQSLSGTGALHLAGLLLRACHTPLPKVYIPEPTWSNHHQVFSSLGFECKAFPYYNYATKKLDIESYLSTLESAEPYSVFVLHACAHNPTGCDPSTEQWQKIGRIIKAKQLFPLFDAAYLGFNSGNVDDDAHPIRYFIDELQLEVGVCISFAKNMGLYGERVGCFFLATHTETAATNTQSMLEMLQRSECSNPPAFGAKLASTVLGNDDLRQAWYADLITMSSRIRSMRHALYNHLITFEAPGTWVHLVRQSGMFGFLGLSPEVVKRLEDRYHIYMASNSRISIAGLTPDNVEYVAHSITECLKT